MTSCNTVDGTMARALRPRGAQLARAPLAALFFFEGRARICARQKQLKALPFLRSGRRELAVFVRPGC